MPKLENMLLTSEQKADIGANWGDDSYTTPCTHCGSVMIKLPANPKGHMHAVKSPELYCSKCRISAPLFKR